MNKYWFKPKLYWYGFTPSSWEWWIATLWILWVLMLSAYSHGFFTITWPSFMQAAGFLFDITLVAAIFTILFTPKTRWELKWNWGNRR